MTSLQTLGKVAIPSVAALANRSPRQIQRDFRPGTRSVLSDQARKVVIFIRRESIAPIRVKTKARLHFQK
jgi:hypothetical protein